MFRTILTKIELLLIILVLVTGYDEDDRLLAELELSDLEMMDDCENIAISIKQALTTHQFREKIHRLQDHGQLLRNQAKTFQLYDSVPYEVLRNWTIITKPGDTLLEENDWAKLVSYVNANEALMNAAKLPCPNGIPACKFNRGGYENILRVAKDEEYLRKSWQLWQELLSTSKEQFPTILDLIPEAASLNDRGSVKSYWEMLQDQDEIYDKAEMIWTEIEPFYRKLHRFINTRVSNFYNITQNSTSIPVYLLGANFGDDWSRIADIILPHPQIHYDAQMYLNSKTPQEIFKIAERLTNELSLGPLGEQFWRNSVFNLSFCANQIAAYCSHGYSEIITCNQTTWDQYLNIFESAIKIALNNDDYLSLPRQSLRYQTIDVALETLSSIIAVENLPHYRILDGDVFKIQSENNTKLMTKLLLVALRVVPKLPYYLLADKWRLQEFENRSENLGQTWWNLRENLQGVSGVTGDEWDFLGDSRIISNEPYLYKFLGSILAFQIFAHHRNSMTDLDENIAPFIGEDENFLALIKDRPTNDWSYLTNFYYGIYEVSASSLLEYFKPLEEYFETAPLQQEAIVTTTTSTTQSTPTPSTTTKNLSNSGKVEKVLNPGVLQQNEPKPNEIEQGKVSSSNSAMYFGGGILVIVIAVVIGGVFVKNQRKKKKLPHNRRFET